MNQEESVLVEFSRLYIRRIIYYCLKIHYFWRADGDGLPAPRINYDARFLQQLILRLTRASLYFEALELLERFVEDCEPQLTAMASSLLASDNFARIACLLRLSKIYGDKGRIKDAEDTLSMREQIIPKEHQLAKLHQQLIMYRFLETQSSKLEKIGQLMQLSTTLLEMGDYDTSLRALEYAVEI
jgi:tetratricopeptide (TPR) repeat protein